MKYFFRQRIKRIKLIKRLTFGNTNPTERYATKKETNLSPFYILPLPRPLLGEGANYKLDEG